MSQGHDPVTQFADALEKERREFPREQLADLLVMRAGSARDASALAVLPALLRMANRALASRWHNAVTEPAVREGIVTGHVSGEGGGFRECWYSGGRWWVRDFVASSGKYQDREVQVSEWRSIEGALAEPWHDDPPRWDQIPKLSTEPPEKHVEPTAELPVGKCEWCKQERGIVPLCALDWYPGVRETLSPSTRAMRAEMKSLCADCASYWATKDLLGNAASGLVWDYVDAARRSFFVQWQPGVAPSLDDVECLLRQFFTGLDVTVERVEHLNGRGRCGFDITFESLATHKMCWVGQNPDEVEAHKQMVGVQCGPESFHAFGSGGAIVDSLAVGLNVFMRKQTIFQRQHLEQRLSRWRAAQGEKSG